MAEGQSASTGGGAIIRRLVIQRFRGIQSLEWRPKPGLNVILGGGDAGKTTILEAIALLLNPSNATVLAEADYFGGDRGKTFRIGAVMSLPPSSGVDHQPSHLFPWTWNGKDAVEPKFDGDDPSVAGQEVYKFCVTGSPELDLTYEVLGPGDKVDRFSPNLRRQIGLVRLSGDDRNDRDLRLVQGSALDRLLSDPSLRSRFSAKFSGAELKADLEADGQAALQALDDAFRDRALPHDLGLGLNAQQGQSIGALVGLTATSGEARLPLASWGAGTRRLAALAIAQASRTGAPITLIDEAERGLEPYRQRKLVGDLLKGSSQVFMTTHSAAVLSAAEGAHLWHLVQGSTIGELATDKIALHQKADPETFLARLAIVCEGPTEIGFLRFVLEQRLSGDLLDRGIKFCNAGGNAFALELIEEMVEAGFNVVGLVDDENEKKGRWTALKSKMGAHLLQWPGGCTEEMVIGRLDETRFDALIADPERGRAPARLKSLVERLAAAKPDLAPVELSFEAIKAAAGADLKALVIAAASGSAKGAPATAEKTWKKHGRAWFKSESGGRELAGKARTFDVLPKLEDWLGPLVTAIDKTSAE